MVIRGHPDTGDAVAARDLLHDAAHALRAFAGLDDDAEGELEAWDRIAVFDLDTPAVDLWEGTLAADNPPKTFVLMTREVDDEMVWDLWWAVDGEAEDAWPVVEVTASGEGQVLAANVEDYLDTLIASHGAHGGASEDDLEAAAEESTPDASSMAGDLADELDREVRDFEALGEAHEEAQETWGDAWMDALEGIDG